MKRKELIKLWEELSSNILNPELQIQFDEAIKSRKTSFLKVTIQWSKGSWSRKYIKTGPNELQEMEEFVFAAFHEYSVFRMKKLPKVKTKRVYKYE